MSPAGTPGTLHQRLLAAVLAGPARVAPIVQTELVLPPVRGCDWDEL